MTSPSEMAVDHQMAAEDDKDTLEPRPDPAEPLLSRRFLPRNPESPAAKPLMSRISVVGVPSSAASYAAGQDLAPAALRSAGLLEQLTAAGLPVHDDGDLPSAGITYCFHGVFPHQGWLSGDLDSVRDDQAGVVHQALELAHVSVWISQRDDTGASMTPTGARLLYGSAPVRAAR